MHGSHLPQIPRMEHASNHHRVKFPPFPFAHIKLTNPSNHRYRKYAGAKFRPLDEVYISSFDADAARRALKPEEMDYYCAVMPQFMLPTPPPSEKSVDDDDY